MQCMFAYTYAKYMLCIVSCSMRVHTLVACASHFYARMHIYACAHTYPYVQVYGHTHKHYVRATLHTRTHLNLCSC